MSAYFVGNLIGRLVASVLIVWIILFLVKRLNASEATRSLMKPVGICSAIIVLVVGLLGSNF